MLNIIPLPMKVELRSGNFLLTPETEIHADNANLWNADYLRSILSPSTGFMFRNGTDKPSTAMKGISLHLNASLTWLGEEGYRLEVQPESVMLEAGTTTGIFYGIQSIRQMLPIEVESRQKLNMEWYLPCVIIEDQPRFRWRGHMLDEGRHFQGKDIVKRTLDLMALQKLNVFHWHLTEDQGWRIEIKRYPLLTKVGSQRAGSAKSWLSKKHDGIPHGGFYTQQDIREIVAYAAERHITVVPEIEMPGHSVAALASYPELSCTGGPFEVSPRFGILQDIYCAGKEATFTFLQNVMDEVLELFPSPFIHIGGDEAPKARWKECPHCQQRIKDEGLKDEEALQVYFVNRMVDYITQRGKRVIGWSEILHEGLTESAIVQFWIGRPKKYSDALHTQPGREIINSYCVSTYLDYNYKLISLQRAYRFEPVFRNLGTEETNRILGLESPLWTEWVRDRNKLDHQTYPRLTAFAETGWSQKDRKNYKDFSRRLGVFLKRLHLLDVHYATPKEVGLE
jgi:hexosaminidase